MASQTIYTGFWVNRDASAVFGATLTLSLRDATILTSFLAFLVTTVLLDCLWSVLVFALYLARPRPPSADPAHARPWVILRNAAGPGRSLLAVGRMLASRRGRRGASWWAYAALALCVVLFALEIAGALVPALIISDDADNLVPVVPGLCSFKTTYFADDDLSRGAMLANELSETVDARSYAAEHYAGNVTLATAASVFPVTALPYRTRRRQPCPFADDICLLGPDSAVTFDTGLLDSHRHLGINAPADDRVQYRWRSTCTPLYITDRVLVRRNETYDNISITADEPVYEVQLGPLAAFGLNYTFFYKQNILDPSGYKLRTVSAIAGNQYPHNLWRPIDALSLADADVTLVFVGTNAIVYAKPVDDAVFQANTTTTADDYYISDKFFRIVACADQHQFCNPATGVCTAMNSTVGEWSSPFVHIAQFATGWRLFQYTKNHLIDDNVRSLGSNALLAKSIVPHNSFISPGLPDDQWQREARRWFETGLAKFQYSVMGFPNVSLPAGYVDVGRADAGITTAQNLTSIPAVNDQLAAQCGQQLVRLNGRGQNVSVFGLALLCAITLVMILLAALLEWWGNRPATTASARWLWQADHLLSLWRAAHYGLATAVDTPSVAYAAIGAAPPAVLMGRPRAMAHSPSNDGANEQLISHSPN